MKNLSRNENVSAKSSTKSLNLGSWKPTPSMRANHNTNCSAQGLGDDLQRMEEELQAVLSSHVHEMTAIASENSKLKTEAEAAQSEIVELKSKIATFKRQLYQFQDDIVKPIKRYAVALSNAMRKSRTQKISCEPSLKTPRTSWRHRCCSETRSTDS